MNYRHAFHAGNFADVVKHAVLALAITHLERKDAAFRVIDTHAGSGLYDLGNPEAQRTGEWRDGIGRLLGPGAEPVPPGVAELLEPYLACARAENGDGVLLRYPGSPAVARRLLRPQDRLVLNELHEADARTLRARFARDPVTKVLQLDGWIALKSLLPPKERRGLMLVDPPFEQPGELARLGEGLTAAVRRFATGVYMLWYPIKDPKPVSRFHRALVATGIPNLLGIEVLVRAPRGPRLNGCGLVIVNPPYPIAEDLVRLAPFLAMRLAQGTGASGTVRWLTEERAARALT